MCLLFITGTNEPPDRTLTVLAIVIPIILSVCVILSCYCFRRYVLEREQLTYVGRSERVPFTCHKVFVDGTKYIFGCPDCFIPNSAICFKGRHCKAYHCETVFSRVSTRQSGSVQFASLHLRTIIFAFPL